MAPICVRLWFLLFFPLLVRSSQRLSFPFSTLPPFSPPMRPRNKDRLSLLCASRNQAGMACTPSDYESRFTASSSNIDRIWHRRIIFERIVAWFERPTLVGVSQKNDLPSFNHRALRL